VRLAAVGFDKGDLRTIMGRQGLDVGTIRRPGKMVVLAASLVEEKRAAQKAMEAEETEDEIAAAARKWRMVTIGRLLEKRWTLRYPSTSSTSN